MSPINSIIVKFDKKLTIDEKSALSKHLYLIITQTRNINIDYFMNDEKKSNIIMFMMTMIVRLQNFECFEGPIITKDRLEFIFQHEKSESALIKFMCTSIIKKLAFDKNRNIILKFADTSTAWVWNMYLEKVDFNRKSLDAFIGSLLGQCIGDALGFIVEGQSATKCREYIEEFITSNTIPKTSFGQYSDDSQLTRELYVSLYQNDGVFSPAMFANRIGSLFQPGHYRIVGYGRTTAAAGEALFKGKHYSETGSKDTTGNGSAMRSAPFGLLLSNKKIEEMCDIVSTFSCITHASPSAIQGSNMIALATRASFMTRELKFNIKAFLKYICVGIKDEMYKDEILNIENLLDNESFAKNRFVFFGKSIGEKQWGDGISTGVYQSTLWALYSFCKYPNDYIKCISLAISCGGDVDTTASMAGAIIGARLGYEKLPRNYLELIHDNKEWNFKKLVDLVMKVYSKLF